MNTTMKLKSLVAAAIAAVGMTAVVTAQAAPTVEITKVEKTQTNGVVSCSYTVGGLEGQNYDLVLKVGATDSAKGAVSTNLVYKDVAEGLATQMIDSGAVLGKAYPNITFYATLDDGKAPWQKNIGAVQLWEGGPYWADRNVGAEKPEDAGFYFWWGGTEGYVRKKSVSWSLVSVKDGRAASFNYDASVVASSNSEMREAELLAEGWIDASGNLTMDHDAARQNLGGDWRMPTRTEIDGLINNTTQEWTSDWNGTGIAGHIVTGKGAYADRSIFLPAAGYGNSASLLLYGTCGEYWSSTPSAGSLIDSTQLRFGSSYFSRDGSTRCDGYTVRAVRGSAD